MMTKHVYKTIIFGAGQIGQMTARLLGNSYQIMCFADNDPRKHGQFMVISQSVLHQRPLLFFLI